MNDVTKTPNGGDALGWGNELHQQAGAKDACLTTNHGVVISDNQNSLRAGERGATLLEDFVLREKINHFDHERIPERVVHARGSAAHGVFELTRSLKDYTCARVLTEVGARTDVFVRFSTVVGGAGSADTVRDVRGFAVKFYTQEGNWDLVGNNIPVFFIQDAIKFPDLVHSIKMEADRGFPQASSAHETFWDFIGLTPESAHMIMWLMSDRTTPRSLRMMEGFGVNTFRLVNDKGEGTFVKFHWRPKLGLQSLLWDEAVKIAGADPDYHRRDLRAAIESGAYPEWEFGVQLISQAQAEALPFDILDATKLIPEEMIPIEIVGRMTLNRNPDNFFAETEQVAFLPQNMPPGIDASEDPLLQGRMFSYLDTQLFRLGGVNFPQLSINQPRGCPMRNFQRDGLMQHALPKGRANYEPNSLEEGGEDRGPRASMQAGFKSFAAPVSGFKIRRRAESFADHYSQARLFYRSQSEVEQNHIVSAFVFELSKVGLAHVRARILAQLANVDAALARRVADGLGMAAPSAAAPAAAPGPEMAQAPSLRLIDKYPPSLKGRVVGLLLSDGADAEAVDAVTATIEAEGASVVVVAPKIAGVALSDGRRQEASGQLEGAPSQMFDAVALILSKEGCAELMKESAAVDFVANAFAHLKAIAATPEAAPLLEKANVKLDAFVFDASDVTGFAAAAATRLWSREPTLRMTT